MNPWIKKALIAIVILAFAALLIFSFQKNFEYVEKTQWQPLSGEAKSNPLYASKLFLRRMGIPTETVESLQNLTILPDTDTVILISSSRETLRDKQFSDILDWVNSGGHLVISGIADWNSFFNGSSLAENADDDMEVDYEELQEQLTSLPTADALQEFLKAELSGSIKFDNDTAEKVSFKGADHPLELGPDYYSSIVMSAGDDTEGLEEITINGKNFAIRQQVEAGLITLVSDFDFINNYKIGEYDHAEILLNIIRGKSAITDANDLLLPQAVWQIHSDETASLFEIIWKYWWALVITLGMLFLAWVLRVSRRFGPLIPKETEDRRNLLEHIDASGAYYWKQQNQVVLLEGTRSAAQQQLAKRIPGWHALPQQDQILLLQKRLDMKDQTLFKALYGNISNSPHEFTETIKQLEHIRTSI